MTTRTIIEWRCERCGVEAAIEDGKPNGWCHMGGLALHPNYQRHGYKQGGPKIGGDICPECASSLLAWWQRQRETVG